MRSRLIGDEVEVLAPPRQLRDDVGRIPEQADRQRPALGRRRAHTRQRVVERVRRLVEVARLQPARDPRWVDLDAQDRGACECRGKRLRPAHPAETGGEHRPPGE